MLLVGNEAGKVAHWLDSHPTLEQRIRRIYGRHMAALPLERDRTLDAATPAQTAPAGPSGPQAPGWTLS
jgi:hypothetical protein